MHDNSLKNCYYYYYYLCLLSKPFKNFPFELYGFIESFRLFRSEHQSASFYIIFMRTTRKSDCVRWILVISIGKNIYFGYFYLILIALRLETKHQSYIGFQNKDLSNSIYSTCLLINQHINRFYLLLLLFSIFRTIVDSCYEHRIITFLLLSTLLLLYFIHLFR